MSRLAAVLLLVLVPMAVVLASEVAPPPRPRALPVAPPPHQPGEPLEIDLTNLDPGLDVTLPSVDVGRVEQPGVPKPIADPLGLPAATVGAPGFPGSKIPGLGQLPKEEPGNNPGAFPGRSGATKARLLRDGGGNEESEKAVALGLAWLARQQKQDGGWEYDAGDKGERIAATGMALLAFLGAGETPEGKGNYAKTVQAGVKYLVKTVPLEGANAGKMTGNAYAQAIGTLALCEAYGISKDKNMLQAAQAAVTYIVKAQGANGSWGYSFGTPGDTSIVGWHIQALKAAKLSKDIAVPDGTFKKAVDFLNLAGGGARKAAYGYNDNAGAAPGTSLTAVGLLCRYYIDGWGPDNPGMAEGVMGLMKRAPSGTTKDPRQRPQGALDMYFYYYATQVVHFYDGDEWKDWNLGPKQADGTRKGGMRDWLIGLQITKDGANQGSFDPDTGFIGKSCGRVGTTALCVLTLEVYYRHLPLYKRANAGDGVKIIDNNK